MRTLPRLLAAALAASLAGAASAAVVFSDNFDANTAGVNATPTGWTVSDGTVDIIGNGFFDFLPGNGLYLDMDGSTSNAGRISRQLALTGGVAHLLAFDLAGNHRNGAQEQVDVVFGGAGGSYSLPRTAGFTTFSLAFTPATTGSYTLSFEGQGGDNIGMLLDRVVISSREPNGVPEPHGLGLAALGLAGLALSRRRRPAR